MPLALIVALAASLGAHVLALLVPDIELSAVPEPPALTAELQKWQEMQKLQTLPKAILPSEALPRPQRKPPLPKRKPQARSASPDNPTPVFSMPEANTVPDLTTSPESSVPTEIDPVPLAPNAAQLPSDSPTDSPTNSPSALSTAATATARMPAHGKIRYRVDRGDQGFELGRSIHEWTLEDGRYRLTAVTETSGLAALLKPLRVELESRGRLTAEGLQPEHFAIRRNGKLGREQADFDWGRMQLKIGGNASEVSEGGNDSNAGTHRLTPGAQDLLSFNYQLGFLPHPEANNSLPIATGKKYTTYYLHALGDEEIEIPAGVFRTLHLRAPGDNTTELWLAYDYLLLPVKIRYLDRHGDSFVQVATEIQFSQEPSPH
jgi:hypothetical protein